MKTYKQWFILLIFMIASSCSNEEDKNLQNNEIPNFVFEESRLLENYQIPKEDVISLQKLGFNESSAVVMEKTDYLKNEISIYYLMENEIEISKDDLTSMTNELLKNKSTNQSKQYRTRLTVASPSEIRVTGVNISDVNLIRGLATAIDRYNALGLGLTFKLRMENARGPVKGSYLKYNSEILVFQANTVGNFSNLNIMQTGYPSDSKPYPVIKVGLSAAMYSQNYIAHAYMHEIGHAIGLRHTDYFDNSISCYGPSIDEGEGDEEAIHIEGTPARDDVDTESIMLTCIPLQTLGEFSIADITALESMYSKTSQE